MSRRRSGRRDSSPYKRNKTAEPGNPESETEEVVNEEGDSQGSLEPGQMAQLIVDMRSGVVDQQAASAIEGPLNDLAKAFAMQAEILRGVHETQVELSQTIKKDKKAEMMVNATDSLNETFKGVRSTQQKLLDELDDRGKKTKSTAFWAIGASLAIVVTIIGLFWWKDSRDQKVVKDSAKELRAEFSDRYDKLFEQRSADQDSTIVEWKELAEKTRKDLRTVETEKNLLKARNSDLELKVKELSGLSKAEEEELNRLRREIAAMKPEQDRLKGKVNDLQSNLTDTLKRLETAKAEANHLRLEVIAKMNRSSAERMAATTEDENAKERIIPRDEAIKVKEGNNEEGANAKPAVPVAVDRVIDDLNDLMSNHRGSRVYRIESVGTVGKHHLEDVVLTESGARTGVIKKIRAKKLDVAISQKGDIVEFNFSGGEVQQKRTGGTMGPWTGFYNDRYRLTVYCLNGEKWMARNYGFFIIN